MLSNLIEHEHDLLPNLNRDVGANDRVVLDAVYDSGFTAVEVMDDGPVFRTDDRTREVRVSEAAELHFELGNCQGKYRLSHNRFSTASDIKQRQVAVGTKPNDHWSIRCNRVARSVVRRYVSVRRIGELTGAISVAKDCVPVSRIGHSG